MENERCQHVIILDRDSGIYLLVLSYNYFVKLQIFHPLKYYIILLLHFAGKTICYFEIREEKTWKKCEFLKNRHSYAYKSFISTTNDIFSQIALQLSFLFRRFLAIRKFFIPTLNTVIQCQTTKLYFCTKLSSHRLS